MRRLTWTRLAPLSTLACAGILIGCGDNYPRRPPDATPDAPDGSSDRRDAADTRDGEAGGDAEGGIPSCPVVAFTSPTEGAMLHASDDARAMQCTGPNGFEYNVTVSVEGAADGTQVELHGAVTANPTTSPPLLATASVSGGQVAFMGVPLAQGMTRLTVEIGGVPCTPSVTVTVDCNLPTCSISKPSHDTLNGVAAPAGDRVSSPGSDYQAAFEVTTDIEDGRPVSLTVNSVDTPSTPAVVVMANASAGVASFAGVTLKPDGSYRITAACTNQLNQTGRTVATFTVDTTPPALTVDRPANGATLLPSDLNASGAFPVCSTTTSMDAVNVPASANADMSNLCVTRGQSTTCVPVTALNTSTCVDVVCPGGAAFDLTVTLYDAAGNPTTRTITGISCTSTLPAVQIVTPLTDAPNFNNVARRLLAATETQTLKDADGAMAGAQTNVVACTDTMGGSARLFVGHRGDATLTALGAAVTVVVAVAGDNCPTGLGFVAKFNGVTLPESTEAADGTLTAATEIRVDVTDPMAAAAVGTSGPTDLWVDSTAPTLSEKTPMPLCGSMVQNNATFTTDVAFNSSTANVSLAVTNGTTATFGPPTFVAGTPGTATFTAVDFRQGANTVVAAAMEPSGNSVSLNPIPMPACIVTVGSVPLVSFVTPMVGQDLCANGNTLTTCVADTTAATPGWQGNVTVHVTSGGVPLTTGNVTFTIAGGAPQVAALNGSGDATLTGITIADGAAVVITATTDNVPQHGVGMTMATFVVDTQPPMAATGLMAVVANRRQTSYTLTWTAPADANGTSSVSSYDVRYSKMAINDANFTTGTSVPFAGAAKMPTQTEMLLASGLYIENQYNFGVVALDGVGNRSPSVSVAAPVAHFNSTVIPAPAGVGSMFAFGYSVDGSTDFDGDGRTDIMVGTYSGPSVYVYSGAANFPIPTTPAIRFDGNANSKFGFSAAVIGDLDGEQDVNGNTFPEVAISSTIDRTIYIYKGRAVWPTTPLTLANADYRIVDDAAFTSTAQFGYIIARLGDFNGDGVDDFAIGAPGSGSTTTAPIGRVVVVFGKLASQTAFPAMVTLPDATQTVTITGENMGDIFGVGLVGLGRFYATGGNTLVVTGRFFNGRAGKLYAFHGQSGTAGALAATAADHTLVGPVANAQYSLTLSVLGSITGVSALPGLGLGNVLTLGAVNGNAILSYGTDATGPFAGSKTFTDSAATVSGDSFGTLVLGGGFSGTSVTASLVGTAGPDIALAPAVEAGTTGHIYIVDGTKYGALAAGDFRTAADVVVPLPAGWAQIAPRSNLVRDIDGDGFADIAIGNYSGVTGDGALGVLW